MWTYRDIKKEGWSKLRKALWTAVLLTLVYVMISGFFSVGQNAINMITFRIQYSGDIRSFFANSNAIELASSPRMMFLNFFSSIAGILTITATFFLLNPLAVGYAGWFLKNHDRKENAGISQLFSPFREGSYIRILGGTAWTALWTIIWGTVASLCFVPLYGLLFAAVISIVFSAGIYSGSSVSMNQNDLIDRVLHIAPAYFVAFAALLFLGVIGYLFITLNRKYAYFFTSFILAENPSIGAQNALNLSKKMTYGMKRRLFLLDLSFIGWWLLSLLTFGLLAIGVMPYTLAVYTEVYNRRKTEQNI